MPPSKRHVRSSLLWGAILSTSFSNARPALRSVMCVRSENRSTIDGRWTTVTSPQAGGGQSPTGWFLKTLQVFAVLCLLVPPRRHVDCSENRTQIVTGRGSPFHGWWHPRGFCFTMTSAQLLYHKSAVEPTGFFAFFRQITPMDQLLHKTILQHCHYEQREESDAARTKISCSAWSTQHPPPLVRYQGRQ